MLKQYTAVDDPLDAFVLVNAGLINIILLWNINQRDKKQH